MRLIVDTLKVADISVITIFPEGGTRLPTVFFVHGLRGDKSQGIELGYLLAERGFLFVSVDAYMHGERYDPYIDDLTQPGKTLYPPESRLDLNFHLFVIAQKTGQDISRLLDIFENDQRVDPTRIGMSGMSMGAFTTYYTAACDNRIRAIAPIIGLPAFTRRWEDLVLEKQATPRWKDLFDSLSPETVKRTQFLRSIDPADKFKSFAPKPLLIMVGDLDTDVPKYYSADFYRDLLPLYSKHPGNLRLSVQEGIGHRVSHGMWIEVADWFVEHLGN